MALTLVMVTFLASWETLTHATKSKGMKTYAILLAVAARAVKLAEVLDSEAVDGDGANTVVLDDLVLGVASTTTDDLAVTVTLEGKSVLTDGIPPDVLNGAGTETVDTLVLVLANDGVLEGSTVLEDEDGITVLALSLTTALNTTAVGLVTTIEGSGDGLGVIVRDGTLTGRDGEAARGTSAKGTHSLGSSQREGGGNNGGSAETHVC